MHRADTRTSNVRAPDKRPVAGRQNTRSRVRPRPRSPAASMAAIATWVGTSPPPKDVPRAEPPTMDKPPIDRGYTQGTTTVQVHTESAPADGTTYEGQVAQAPGAQADDYGTSFSGSDGDNERTESA